MTVVFSDLQGSTSLGERLDSESLREVLSRYFEVMRGVLEEHGGLIEKYIGDAIMAVFGMPRAHEDDALRAVSAAAGMKQALEALNEELDRRWGVRLVNRTGVNTGEVVAGDHTTGQRLVSGDTVNVAARLEQAAPPLETLIGEATYRLVRHAVQVEAVEPLELKGKSERVPGYRLTAVREKHSPIGRADVPMVGRQRELRTLLDTFDGARRNSIGAGALLLGDPGVGKSRLLAELTSQLSEEAHTLRGRCLPYGRGITFWPLVEIVRGATGTTDSNPPEVTLQKLDALLPESADVVARIASAIGLGETVYPLEEIYWATRKLLEALGRERPLIVVFEDLHWAEAAFLDLVESLVANIAAPVLVLCSGRPELVLDVRPEWRDLPDMVRLELQPLTTQESGQLVDSLLGSLQLPAIVRDRVGAASDGNPLFLEQLTSMLVDEGFIQADGTSWKITRDLSTLAIPGSIQALLAARLDLLSAEERGVLEPASVMGLLFAEDALAELVPDGLRASLERNLSDLSRRRFVIPEPDSAPGRWYRFQHMLIRDTAYNRLLKRTRATLHERFANWAERANPEGDGSFEYAEIHGYHLEQAFRYLSELGPLDDHGRLLGARGSAHLGGAGGRAFERGDMNAASNLLQRAADLLPTTDPNRVALLPWLGEALMESGEFDSAARVVDEGVQGATKSGDLRLLADASLSRLLVRHHTEDLSAWCADVQRETQELIPALEAEGADAELAKAWRLAAYVHGIAGRWDGVVEAERHGIEHARRAGRQRLEARMSAGLAQALRDGPTPVPEAIRRCEEILASGLVDQQAEVLTTLHLAYLNALLGEIATARELCRQAVSSLSDLGGRSLAAAAPATITIGWIELLADDAPAAAAELKRDYEALGEIGERYFRPTIGALLAEALASSGLHADAMRIATEVEAIATDDDLEAQAIWRAAKAKALAAHGQLDEAVQLIERAVQMLEGTDALIWQADTLVGRALLLMQAGSNNQAVDCLETARSLYARKGADLPLHRIDALAATLELLAAAESETPRVPASPSGLLVSRRSSHPRASVG